jgi:CRP-like cAMP-binding protein
MGRMSATFDPPILPDDVRDALEAVASTRHELRTGVLFRRGEPASGVYVIRRGRVILTLNERIRRTMEQGSILGLTAVFSGQPYSLTATADEDCELAFITREKVIEFVRFNPSVALYLLEILASEVAALRELAPVRKSRNRRRGEIGSRHPRRRRTKIAGER